MHIEIVAAKNLLLRQRRKGEENFRLSLVFAWAEAENGQLASMHAKEAQMFWDDLGICIPAREYVTYTTGDADYGITVTREPDRWGGDRIIFDITSIGRGDFAGLVLFVRDGATGRLLRSGRLFKSQENPYNFWCTIDRLPAGSLLTFSLKRPEPQE